MGQNGERLAKRLGIGREEQDAYALASHHRAARATVEGLLARQIVPAWAPPRYDRVAFDNGIRGDSSAAALARLKPAFDRRFGTVTAGNSSFLTDGAAAVLLVRGRRPGARPRADGLLRGSAVTGADPLEELLLGPAFATPRALDAAGLRLEQVEVVELHEAFAAQVLAVLQLLEDEEFCRERLGRTGRWDGRPRAAQRVGRLAVGRPSVRRDRRAPDHHLLPPDAHEKARYGAVAACAAGAIGIALVLERA